MPRSVTWFLLNLDQFNNLLKFVSIIGIRSLSNLH